MEEHKFYACDNHIDDVIDDFINLYGITPNLNLNEEREKNYCNYCLEYGKYILIFSKN